ncbi:DUF4129 domain-containing protein [Halorussus ruber]|uniref:DUF4129 domain-containing protein n=1 Tax=Halorussus ruber TaxID=1126238 RepID=UPI00109293C1|nr:DUF4129 domain-containing protein [Halorussus ruber]
MRADTILTAVVALCCVLAIGATSTTLDSTVSTDPDDVAEVDYDKIPIGSGHAKNLDDAIDGGKSASSDSGASPNSDSGAGADKSGTGSQSAASKDGEGGDSMGSAQGQGGPSEEASGEGQQDQQTGGDGKETTQSSGGGGQDSNSGKGKGLVADQPTLLERLMALLQQLFDLLLTALPYAILLALLGALYRYRDRILSRVAPSSSTDDSGEDPPEPDPDNPISAAWYEMVERLDLDDRRDLTPREYAAAARRRGADADAVQTLTGLFEEVRYGGARVTEERRERAEEIRDRVRSQLDRGDAQIGSDGRPGNGGRLETDGGTEDQR